MTLDLDRRKHRSDDPLVALHHQLSHVRTEADLDAVVIADGAGLVVAGANALNMVWERDIDRLMRRTRNRPLPAGRMSPKVALIFGILTSVAALPVLALGVNAVRTHDYVAAILVLGTGLAVLRASVTLLRPSIGE